MAVNYQKLWDILTDRSITRSELREVAGITANAMVKLGKNESVQVEVLAKICRVLNCTMDEILEIEYSATSVSTLPDVDFTEFVTWNQYSTLGITKISDFSAPHTPNSVKTELIEYFTCSKLSMEACEELIDALSEKGVHISFPKEIAPDINYIPQKFSWFEDESESVKELVHQQIHNYIAWAIKSSGMENEELFEHIAHTSILPPKYIIEHGYVESHFSGSSAKFVGTSMTAQSVKDTFPLNLLGAIFGVGSLYVLANRLPDLLEQIDKLIDTLLPSEVFWIRLKYQYGGTDKQILRGLGLPHYETLLWGVNNNPFLNKGLRKLRHPSRSKKIYEYININPYKVSYSSLAVYDDWVSEIEKSLTASLDMGITLTEALTKFYTDDVVDAVAKAENKWKGIPDVSIDDMDLSWKSYIALEQASITSLAQLWEVHGRHISLTDFENTDLRFIAGLGTGQVAELLSKMAKYELLPVAANYAADIVDYAEKIASGNKDKPSIACNVIPRHVLRKLLQMKYRRLDEVMVDYTEGNINAVSSDTDEQKVVCDTLQMLISSKFPVLHFSASEYWDNILIKNPNYTFEDIRNAYILDKPLKCNPNELQDHISDLFPTAPLAFTLMHKTRSRTIHWIAWPVHLFTKTVIKHAITNFAEVAISKAYYATDNSSDGCRWIVAAGAKNGTSQIYFFKLGNGLIPVVDIEPIVRESIFQAIEFNAELLGKIPCIEEYIPASFVAAQKDFCEFYGSKAHNQEEQQFFCKHEPLIFAHSANKQKIAADISIEDLDLSVRSYNCLKRAGINTVNDIIQVSNEDFTHVRNMGRKSLVEVLTKLKAIGIPLKDYQKELLIQSKSEVGLQ